MMSSHQLFLLLGWLLLLLCCSSFPSCVLLPASASLFQSSSGYSLSSPLTVSSRVVVVDSSGVSNDLLLLLQQQASLISAQQTALTAQQAATTALSNRVSTLESQLNSPSLSIGSAGKSALFDAVNQRSLASDVTSVNISIALMNQKIDDANILINTADETIRSIQTQIKTQMPSLNASVGTLITQMNSPSAAVGQIGNSALYDAIRVRAMNSDLASVNGSVAQQSGFLATATANIATLQSQINTPAASGAPSSGYSALYSNLVTQLSARAFLSDLSAANMSIAAVQSQLSSPSINPSNLYSSLQSAIATANTNIAVLQTQLSAPSISGSTAAGYSALYSDVQAAVAAINASVAVMQAQINFPSAIAGSAGKSAIFDAVNQRALSSDLTSVNGSVAQQSGILAAATANIATLQSQMNTPAASGAPSTGYSVLYSNLLTQLSARALNADLVLLNNSVATLESQFNIPSSSPPAAGYSVLYSTLQTQLSARALSSDIATTNSNIAAVNSTLAAQMQSSFAVTNTNVAACALQTSLTTTNNNVAALTSSIAAVNTRVTDANSSISALQSSVQSANLNIGVLQSQMNTPAATGLPSSGYSVLFADLVAVNNSCSALAPQTYYYPNCYAMKQANPATPSGTYIIRLPSGVQTSVYCDHTNYGGGWTLVVNINAASYAHVTASAVNPSLVASGPSGGSPSKFDDTTINALKSGSSPAFRLECGSVTGYFPTSCVFGAATTASGGCTAESYTFPPPSYGTTQFAQSEITGVSDGSSATADRLIYGDKLTTITGCDVSTGWGNAGRLYVR
jgi:predicted  nucleic acid-binding Zn-ribbon protein